MTIANLPPGFISNSPPWITPFTLLVEGRADGYVKQTITAVADAHSTATSPRQGDSYVRFFAGGAWSTWEPAGAGGAGAGINILGNFDTEADLVAAHPVGNRGDAYLVGEAGDLFVWDTVNSEWVNVGTIRGPEGPTGPPGPAFASPHVGDIVVDGRVTANDVSIQSTPSFANDAVHKLYVDTLALAGDVTGQVDASTVSRIQGRNVSNAPPSTGQSLVWTAGAWTPQTVSAQGIDPDLPLIKFIKLTDDMIDIELDRAAPQYGCLLQVWRWRNGKPQGQNGRTQKGGKAANRKLVRGFLAIQPGNNPGFPMLTIPQGVKRFKTLTPYWEFFRPPNVRKTRYRFVSNRMSTKWIREGGTGWPTIQSLGLMTNPEAVSRRGIECILKFGTARQGGGGPPDTGFRYGQPSAATMHIKRWKFHNALYRYTPPYGQSYWGLRVWFE